MIKKESKCELPETYQNLKINSLKQRLSKREIWINGIIDDSLVETLYMNLIDMQESDTNKPITIMINSNGGNLSESSVATDIIGTISNPVKTIALAKANSGGFMIFMAGKERICHDFTELMMHNVACFMGYRKTNDINNYTKHLDSIMDKQASFFSRQTGGKTSKEYWLELFKSDKDKWFSVEEAIELGIVHKVIKRPEAINDGLLKRKPYMWNNDDLSRIMNY